MAKRLKRFVAVVGLAVVSCTAVVIAACDSCNGEKDPPKQSTSISEVTKNGTKGTQYTVEGVVYGKVSNGVFISDESGAIFVQSTSDTAVGDKLSVKGTLAVAKNNAVSLEQTEVSKTASNQTALKPTDSSLKDIAGLVAGKSSYYKYVTVSGNLAQSDGVYNLTEGSYSLVFDGRSDTDKLAEYTGKKVDVSVITCGYSTTWEAVYVDGDSGIKEHQTDLDSVKEEIFTNVGAALPGNAYFSVNLPVKYESEPGVKFEWSVKTGADIISVEGDKALIKEPTEDTAVTLTLKISNGTAEATRDYNITVKAADTVSIEDLPSAAFGVVVKTQGKVVAKGMSQVMDRISVLIEDESGNLVAVDTTRKDIDGYKLGDTVKAAGLYSAPAAATNDTFAVAAHLSAVETVLVSDGADYNPDYSTKNYETLATAEDYERLVKTPELNSNKLYKIVNPWLIYSGNTSYNFIRFGANGNSAASGIPVTAENSEPVNWYYCFARNALEYSAEGLEETLGVPFLNQGAKYYEGYTIYAYAMYMGGSTWQFILPGEDACIVDKTVLVPKLIDKAFGSTTVIAKEDGALSLLRSTPECGDITWTSSVDGIVNLETGEYKAVTQNVRLTLTAHYFVDGTEHTHNIEVLMLAGDPEYMTVSEALALDNGKIDFVKGVIVGFGPNTGTGIPGGAQKGVYISDGKQLLFIPDGQFARSEDEANFDKVYYLADGHKIKVGDELYFECVEKNGTTITLAGSVTLNAENADVTWAPEFDTTVVNSFADMQTFFENTNNTGTVVKFVATAENPLYLGGSSSTYDSLNLKVYFGDVPGGVNASNVKIGGRTIAVKARSSEHTLGLKWWQELNPDMPEAFVATDTQYGFVGEVYAVWVSSTSTYSQLALLSEGFTLRALNVAELAENEIKSLIPESVNAGEGGVLNLASSTAHAENITWTCDKPEIFNCETGAFVAVTEDTDVALTARYSIEGVDYSVNITVKFTAAAEVELTLTEYLTAAKADTLPAHYHIVAYVAALGSTSSNSAEWKDGVILTDGVNTVWYNEDVYSYNEADLKKGDKVKLSGITFDGSNGNQIITGGTNSLEVLSSDNAIDYSNANLYATVSSDEELATLASGMDSPLGGVLVKFTGDFSFVGTGTSNCRYQLNYKDAASSAAARYKFGDYEDATHGNRTFSFSVAGNNYTFDKWYEACGMPEGKASTCYPVTGTIYAVGCYYGATMYAWSIVSIDCSARAVETE